MRSGVDLADMLLSLYQIPCKKKRWYEKVFRRVIDMRKISTWMLCRHHFRENGKPNSDQKSFAQFSLELSDALMLINKVSPSSSREQLPKRRRLEPSIMDKKPSQALPVTDDRFDQVAHWPSSSTNKKWCRLYCMTCRMHFPNARSFSVYWLTVTVSLISIQNHIRISSRIDFFSNRKELVMKSLFFLWNSK